MFFDRRMLMLCMLFLDQYEIFFLASGYCLDLQFTLLNLHQPVPYPIGLLTYQLLQTHLLSLTYYLLTKPLKRHLTDSGIHPTEFCCLFLCIFFFQKNNTNRVLSNEFLSTLTKFYKINLLYRVLLFSFSIKIIHHTFPNYNFLFFSL